ncbi:MAG: START domain-containing protein, partial [Thermodesulfobacteriota bacterium]
GMAENPFTPFPRITRCTMNKARLAFLCSLLAIIVGLAASPAFCDDGWKLVMNKNGIKAYMREVPGSPIKEVRAVATMDATLENIGELLRDTPACLEWLPYCKQAEVLKTYHRNKMDLYYLLSPPWPVKNRDLVINSDTFYDLDAGRAIVNLTATQVPCVPETNDAIRIKDFSGQYVFEYIDRNRTGVIYTYRVDMAGAIPAFVMNIMGKYTLYDTIQNLRRMVKLQKYIDLAKKSPDREICESILNDKDKVRNVFRTRLGEFIGDKKFVDEISSDDDMLACFFSSKTGLSEILLYGWGSDESKKKAISALLTNWLPKKVGNNPKLVEKMAKDKVLVDAILTGNGNALAIVESYAKKA